MVIPSRGEVGRLAKVVRGIPGERTLVADTALVQDQQAVGANRNFNGVVGDEDQPGGQGGDDGGHGGQEVGATGFVQTLAGFVEQEQRGTVHGGAGQEREAPV